MENVRNLGVMNRYLVVSQNPFTSDYGDEAVIDVCCAAAAKCLEAEDVGGPTLLICLSDYADYLCPAMSGILLSRLSLSPYALHINLQGMACAGLPKALDLAESHLMRFPNNQVLIVVSGVNSGWFIREASTLDRVISPSEVNGLSASSARREADKWLALIQAFLFGDGAAALLVSNSPQEGPEVLRSSHLTNLEPEDYKAGFMSLIGRQGSNGLALLSRMDRDLGSLGVRYAQACLHELIPEPGQAKKWMVHTGSAKILKTFMESHGIQFNAMRESFEVLANYGNLAGASLPFILKSVLEKGELKNDDLGIMLGFGWGFSAGASLMKF